MKTLAGLLLLLGTAANAGGLYKWVDESGKVHYSDSPPLQSQQQGVAELSKQGTVTKPAESPAARQAREAAEAAQKQHDVQRLENTRRDNALVESYASLQQLQAERAKQQAVLQSALDALQLRAQGLAMQVRNTQQDIAQSQRNKQAPPQNSLRNLKVLQAEQQDLAKQITVKQQELAAFHQKTQNDLSRYRQLRGE